MKVEGTQPWNSFYAPERQVRKTNAGPPKGWIWSEEDDSWIIDEAAGYVQDPKTRKAINKSELPDEQ